MEEKSTRWWQSVPAVIAGITATITAITGLIVAIQQTGWLASSPSGPDEEPAAIAAPVQQPADDPAPSAVSVSGAARALPLPELRDHVLGDVSYTLLDAQLLPGTTERNRVRIRMRMTNRGAYPANFWERSFRLLVDGAPIAPEEELNEVVDAESAREGLLTFSVSQATRAAKLKISSAQDSTLVPLDLAPR
jgi:hypothetical protein